MAHKTGTGSTKNGRDSKPKFLGLKKNMYQYIQKGNILVRQHGLKYSIGKNVKMGKDYTLYAKCNGYLMILNKNQVHIIPKKLNFHNKESEI